MIPTINQSYFILLYLNTFPQSYQLAITALREIQRNGNDATAVIL